MKIHFISFVVVDEDDDGGPEPHDPTHGGGLSSAPPIPAGIWSFRWNSGGFRWNEI